jgi:hypothetical protein
VIDEERLKLKVDVKKLVDIDDDDVEVNDSLC